jgi:hypothetical protein
VWETGALFFSVDIPRFGLDLCIAFFGVMGARRWRNPGFSSFTSLSLRRELIDDRITYRRWKAFPVFADIGFPASTVVPIQQTTDRHPLCSSLRFGNLGDTACEMHDAPAPSNRY